MLVWVYPHTQPSLKEHRVDFQDLSSAKTYLFEQYEVASVCFDLQRIYDFEDDILAYLTSNLFMIEQ